MKIKLYEYGPTRSVRVRWTLNELGLEYESVENREMFGSDELKAIHPLGRLPAIVVDGKGLFESVAICNYLCDLNPDKGLIAKPGTYQRGQHDQWSTFALTEVEAWLWSSARHSFILAEEERVPEIMEPNAREAATGLSVFEKAYGDRDWLIENQFSVTDINVAYAINWANGANMLGDMPALRAFLKRCKAREHCCLPA